MIHVTTDSPAPRPEIIGRRRWLHLRTPRAGLTTWVAAALIAAATLMAILAPWIAPHDPNTSALLDSYAPPSPAQLLGADALGRDILSRLIWGARPALLGPLLVIVIAAAVGVVLAVLAALSAVARWRAISVPWSQVIERISSGSRSCMRSTRAVCTESESARGRSAISIRSSCDR